jgi:ribosome modulation factor
MAVIDMQIREIAVTGYSEGSRARVYGKGRDANPYPEDSPKRSYWLDGWSHFDEMNGGGPRIAADYSHAPLFTAPDFQHFFVIPVVDEGGNLTFGEWTEYATSQEAANAGKAAACDHRGVIVVGTMGVVDEEENFYTPIAVFGEVPELLLSLFASGI